MTAPDALAQALLAARRDARPIPAGAIPEPRDEAEAYAAQALTIAALGPVGGWKTGRRAPDAPMTMAPIPAAMVRETPATFAAAESRLRGVELEIAFRLDADPPRPDAPDFAAALRRVVSVMPAIEVIDSRLAEGAGAAPLLKLADLQINAGLVVGAPARERGGLPLDRCTLRWEIAGDVAMAGPAETPGGDAFDTLCAFARRVGAHCGGLRKGQIVTTGSLTGMIWAPPGARVAGSIDGLGEVAVRFAP